VNLVYRIEHKNPEWKRVLANAIAELTAWCEANDAQVKISDVLRSLDQNAKQWPMLRDIAAVVPMTINGVPQRASEEDWKAVLSAAFVQEVRFAQNPCGPGLIALGVSTSGFTKKEFSDYIEFLYAFGSERSVTWSEKAEDTYRTYRHQPTRSKTP